MPTKKDLENAKQAFDDAWKRATVAADEVIDGLEKRDLMTTDASRKLFEDKAQRALVAHDSYMKAARLASKVMEEYYGLTRLS